MIDLDRYECNGQMDLFDFIENETSDFCWDDDINEIVKKLEELAESYGLEAGKAEFTVWDHVPHLGYRLWLDVRGTRAELFREDFQNDVEVLVEYAKCKECGANAYVGSLYVFQ